MNTEQALVRHPSAVRPSCGHTDAIQKIAHRVPLGRPLRWLLPDVTRTIVLCGSCAVTVDAIVRDSHDGRLDLDDFAAVKARVAPLSPRNDREIRRFIRDTRKEAA